MDISLNGVSIHIRRADYGGYGEENAGGENLVNHLPVIAAAVRKRMRDKAACASPSVDELIAIKAAIAAYEADKQLMKTRIAAKPPAATAWKLAAKLRIMGI